LEFYRPSEIIIYVIGGVTYEESYHIHMMNKQSARIVLGGSYIHNFSSFMEEVLAGAPSSLANASNELLSTKRR
jgi:vacuolar protein sorting-associated protein 45